MGGAYNLLDVFFVYKPMVPPEYNWPEGWGGGGGGGLLNGRFIEQLTRSSLQLMKIP